MNILIVTGGSVQSQYLKDYLKDKVYDRIIAADAGLAHCEELSLVPTEILGDFDSLKHRELLKQYEKQGVPVLSFPTRKDFTDTHLAMLHAKDLLEGAKEGTLTVVGATGTRMDHSMANIGLLTQFADLGIDGKIVDKNNTITMLKGPCEKIFYKTEDRKYISLLACSPQVTGITLAGFDYPLQDATMRAFDSLGISNEILDKEGMISVREGYLLVIQSQD